MTRTGCAFDFFHAEFVETQLDRPKSQRKAVQLCQKQHDSFETEIKLKGMKLEGEM